MKKNSPLPVLNVLFYKSRTTIICQVVTNYFISRRSDGVKIQCTIQYLKKFQLTKIIL
jgi:hypothetical protein